ncbi:MAG: hypothetical protein PHF00_00170 [Elusimicrobia bacterium]|nr:hypothetical protein [Elusimicrobiota bacterium]
MARFSPLRGFKTPKLPLFKAPRLKPPRLSPKVKAKVGQGMGKLRRWALTTIKERYIAEMASRRQGECLRCGLCCKLLFKCPFLQTLPSGLSRCRIHKRRPDNCKYFPIDEKDIRERDSLGADRPCGFWFVEQSAGRG